MPSMISCNRGGKRAGTCYKYCKEEAISYIVSEGRFAQLSTSKCRTPSLLVPSLFNSL